ncbi:MAG: 50S ribosomal protein L25 [Tenericutes bacterium]|nr:50S ribosomal protein L25 [Mycoplasmatota bacterium]
MKVELRVEPLRVVRSDGKVPGVIFGKNFVPVSVQVEEKDLNATVHQYGHSQTFNIKLGKTTHTVYIKEIQRDIINPHHYLNVKLQKVGKGDTITSNIPLNIIGKEFVEKANVSVQLVSDSVEVEFEVGKGVSSIDLDISKLVAGDSIRVKELTIPKGLKVLANPEELILNIIETKPEEVEETEEAGIEFGADPTKVEAIKQKGDQ